jgi:voltage-gated potassium channel Kch
MDNNKLPSKKDPQSPGVLARLVDTLIGIGLGESLLRTGTTLLSVALLVVVIWLLRLFYSQEIEPAGASASALEAVPTISVERNDGVQQASLESFGGIPRLAQVHTTIPSRPRQDVEKYTVLAGDTIFGHPTNIIFRARSSAG